MNLRVEILNFLKDYRDLKFLLEKRLIQRINIKEVLRFDPIFTLPSHFICKIRFDIKM
jgi:Fe2+ or Zn2+ uptake regulation protein